MLDPNLWILMLVSIVLDLFFYPRRMSQFLDQQALAMIRARHPYELVASQFALHVVPQFWLLSQLARSCTTQILFVGVSVPVAIDLFGYRVINLFFTDRINQAKMAEALQRAAEFKRRKIAKAVRSGQVVSVTDTDTAEPATLTMSEQWYLRHQWLQSTAARATVLAGHVILHVIIICADLSTSASCTLTTTVYALLAWFIVINIGLVVVLVLLKGSPREPLAMKWDLLYESLVYIGFVLLYALFQGVQPLRQFDESTFPLRATVLWVLSHAVTYVAILRPLRHSNDIARMHFRLEALMRSPAGREAFGRFLEREFCTELMEFCVGVAKFVDNCNNREIMANQAASVTRSFFADGGTAVAPLDEKRIAEMTEEATQIYETYIDEGSPREINVSGEVRAKLTRVLKGAEHNEAVMHRGATVVNVVPGPNPAPVSKQSSSTVHKNMFEDARREVLSILDMGPFTRFVILPENGKLLKDLDLG
ncbi:unnamed protein product (mitochondrion) [Plasmodiophora brassicae]|uniref:RGS domain-containing protein n=1 Tax=Plasmodiophora brassicae TaxID=37360 RepID=A0A0G4IJH1_PLABS|nr:hypothetical protein PBRA_004080 [Plasmodiophora brassicae]SPQ96239.1 unnamed protein product [Plasmodiophora brassicae]